MKLKEVLLNLITLGWHSYVRLKEFEKKESAQVSSVAETPIASSDYVEELKAAIKKTQLVQAECEKSLPRMTVIAPYSYTDPVFLQAISEIADSRAFKYFLFSCQQDIFEMLHKAPADKSTEIMGMAKGFRFLMTTLNNVENAYKESASTASELMTSEDDYV